MPQDADFSIKQGDRRPYYQATLTDQDGDPVNLAAATVRFHMVTRAGTVLVNEPALVTAAGVGEVEYQWAATDTDEVGLHLAEWEVTWGPGVVETYPNDRHLLVAIRRDLA
jgi:hypothetical protein